MKLALIDHYDSFTYNVIDWLRGGGITVELVPYDDADGLARLMRAPSPLVLSPGPRRPEDAQPTIAMVQTLLGRVPILGICLGHQILAHVAGARIVRGIAPFHGSTRRIIPRATEPFSGLTDGIPPFHAALYNSLVVEPQSLKAPWQISAFCELGEVQAIHWKNPELPGSAPAYGLQFHPESFLSERATELRAAWLAQLKLSNWD